jgi:SpoVK/Ycf46/Vps4 family AAA+-type ATPase
MVRRASDLLSKWVGEAEQNIAAMFREAAQEGAVLLLDEADGLLADRRDASRNWEVTQVNEMLTHMEEFEGLFICTTNLLERLDQASLRRFSFKVSFAYLKPAQSLALFEETWSRVRGADNVTGSRADEALRGRLARLENLTPGDFAAVARQCTALGEEPDANNLIAALEDECRIKGGVRRPMGFAV